MLSTTEKGHVETIAGPFFSILKIDVVVYSTAA
jgi:hypothetical protein